MKKVFHLVILLLVDATVCFAQTKDKKYDYLGILNSMPAIPENTVTASKADKEAFKEKLSKSNEWLWDMERAMINQKDINIATVNLKDIESLEKEFEALYKPIDSFLSQMLEKEGKLENKRYIDEDSLEKLNAPYYEQLKLLSKKPQNAENKQLKKELLQKIYTNKLSINQNLAKINDEILHEWLSGLKRLAPAVAKLDNFSKKLINSEDTGIILLRNYYKKLENSTYFFNVGSYEESSTFDIYRYTNPGDFNDMPSNLMNSLKSLIP
mgnify:CR=1 FL=1